MCILLCTCVFSVCVCIYAYIRVCIPLCMCVHAVGMVCVPTMYVCIWCVCVCKHIYMCVSYCACVCMVCVHSVCVHGMCAWSVCACCMYMCLVCVPRVHVCTHVCACACPCPSYIFLPFPSLCPCFPEVILVPDKTSFIPLAMFLHPSLLPANLLHATSSRDTGYKIEVRLPSGWIQALLKHTHTHTHT